MEVNSLDTTKYHLHNCRSILIKYILWESLTWYNTSLALILLTRIILISLTRFTIQHHHFNHMRIHKTWYDSQVRLDITYMSGEWLLMLYKQQQTWLKNKISKSRILGTTTTRECHQNPTQSFFFHNHSTHNYVGVRTKKHEH